MLRVEIRVREQLDEDWAEWLDGFNIFHAEGYETVLSGCVPDQAALYGIVSRLRDLGVKLTSLSSEEIKEAPHEKTQ
jgi:hypothetical protein